MKLKIFNLIILIILLSFTACKENSEKVEPSQTTTTIAENEGMNLANILGTWINVDNPEQQFSLYNDGSVSQRNFSELEMKDWTLKENKIVFARKNSNGEQTQMNSIIYTIQELTNEKLILENNGSTLIYNKEQ